MIDEGQFIAISHKAARDSFASLVLSDDHTRVVDSPERGG
jgi:hypothetical protein